MKKVLIAILVTFLAVMFPAAAAFATVDSTTRVAVGNGPWGVVVSPDGAKTYAVNALDHSVSVINNSTQTVERTINLSGVTIAYGIAISPDGSKIVVSSPADDKITSILTSAPYTQTSFLVGASTPLQISISPDNQYAFVTCNGSNSVVKVELIPSGYVGAVTTGNNPVGISRKPGTNLYYVTDQVSDSVTVVNGNSMTAIATIPVTATYPYGIAFTPDGSKAFVTGQVSNQVSVISSQSNSEVSVFSTGNYPQGVAVSTDGSKVYVANAGSGTVDVFDTSTYSRLETAISDYTPTEIAVSPTNNSIWVSKYNDQSVDNIFFSWPQPTPSAPELASTGSKSLPPIIFASILLISGLTIFSIRKKLDL